MLTEQQLREYREEGYVMLGSIFTNEELEALRAEEARARSYPFVMATGEIEPDGQTIFRSQLANYSAPVREFVTRGRHIEVAKQLVGPNVIAWFNQYVTKLPAGERSATGKLAEFPWHQDNGYARVEPATNITIWCALDDVGLDNGCVWVMPRSHKDGVRPHVGHADSWHLDVQVDGEGVPALLKAGEAVAFSGLTLHRSKENRTNKPRRAFFMEYADAAAVSGEDRTPVVNSPQSWLVAGRIEWPVPNSAK